MQYIEWQIPLPDAKADRFGALAGESEAWAAMEMALLDGWVVEITTFTTRGAFAREMRKMAKSEDRFAHIKQSGRGESLFVWWSA
jgi:hypothetical protein